MNHSEHCGVTSHLVMNDPWDYLHFLIYIVCVCVVVCPQRSLPLSRPTASLCCAKKAAMAIARCSQPYTPPDWRPGTSTCRISRVTRSHSTSASEVDTLHWSCGDPLWCSFILVFVCVVCCTSHALARRWYALQRTPSHPSTLSSIFVSFYCLHLNPSLSSVRCGVLRRLLVRRCQRLCEGLGRRALLRCLLASAAASLPRPRRHLLARRVQWVSVDGVAGLGTLSKGRLRGGGCR